jgi:hypothetical protein
MYRKKYKSLKMMTFKGLLCCKNATKYIILNFQGKNVCKFEEN